MGSPAREARKGGKVAKEDGRAPGVSDWGTGRRLSLRTGGVLTGKAYGIIWRTVRAANLDKRRMEIREKCVAVPNGALVK